MISGLLSNDTQSWAHFESKLLVLLSYAKSGWGTPDNRHNMFQIVSAVNGAHSSVLWWGSAWLLEWSEQSTNQYDCSRLFWRGTQERAFRMIAAHLSELYSKVSWHGLGQQHKGPVITVSGWTVWVKENPDWLVLIGEMLMWILSLHLCWLLRIKYFDSTPACLNIIMGKPNLSKAPLESLLLRSLSWIFRIG